MTLNIGDKKTRLLLSLAKTPLLFYPHYKYHLPLPSVMMIENTNHCNAECVMCHGKKIADDFSDHFSKTSACKYR